MSTKHKALIVGVNLNSQDSFEESMEELKNLTEACNYEVAGRMEQNLKSIHPAYYIGTGKVEEMKPFLEELEIDVVVFNDELSPMQLKNLEKALDIIVLDRTNLILEIFAKRAKTKEARLQVDVAQLQYILPRLKGAYEALGRQGGGAGLKNRGAGEKKIELDRRRIEDQITELQKRLKEISKKREVQRKRRAKSGLPMVALVGYTNAGKSTIMNEAVEKYGADDSKKVWVKDMLFATLDTSIRKIELPNQKAFLLSDTVGFVSNLPHNLIKAFHSTLEEVREADLLLHVVDISNPDYREQMKITEDTLKQIGALDVPMLYVYNKGDLAEVEIPKLIEDKVYISAKEHIGLEILMEAIERKVFKAYKKAKFLIPFKEGEVVSHLNQNATVLNQEYKPEGTLLEVECKEKDYEKYQEYLVAEEKA
ncbi:GTPase HflX [Isachenkonia alkalipeptolytica]|uniref:GTPase HflX n=1 Tax=Isachenkonia alkalipeptolytica TaxID=2565777 RepID=A0AA43XIN0_9CLOT|nr:GTPase HflX [Isachenkonia alkalipeptolytica]NBG87277.1 GTPase HflX [Isachenkonia alkalipeptolytica]